MNLYVKILNKIATWIQQYKKGLYTSIKKELYTITKWNLSKDCIAGST